MARLGIGLPTIEKVLNRASGSLRGTVSAYRKHGFNAEKQHALDAWGAFVERLVAAEAGGNVVGPKSVEYIMALRTSARRKPELVILVQAPTHICREIIGPAPVVEGTSNSAQY